MHTFRVWAPKAKSLAVRIADKDHPADKGERGWWSATIESAGPGTDYWFVIDNADPVPDPRSRWQPQGVNGPSRLVDDAAFQWTDKNWQARPLPSSVLYELHIGTFTPGGTFESAIEKLDYLVALGITHVEIMPVNEFSGKWGWGYDGVDLFAPQHTYGTPDQLKQLINACHEKGLAVILDVVYNHFGPAGNYLDRFGPYFTDAYHTPWGPAVNLDHAGSDEVRRFIVDNACMWLGDYHFDGLRLDAIHAYFDRSATHLLELLSLEVNGLSSQLGRHFILIAESDLNDPRVVTSREAGGFGIDAQWSDDFHHAVHTLLTGELKGYYEEFGEWSQLAKALTNAWIFDGIYSPHRERQHGRPPVGLPGYKFLGYSQNHDQVGNRAQGERLSHLVSVGKQKIAAALVLTSPFVPMLFQGEEWAASTPFLYFTQHEDADLGRRVSEGRRSEFKYFGWKPEEVPDPQDPATFDKSKLKWDEISSEPHATMLAWYKQLIQLRRSSRGLADGRMDQLQVTFDEGAKWLLIRRGDIEVACNFADHSNTIQVTSNGTDPICSEPAISVKPGSVEMPAESVAIFQDQRSAVQHLREHAAG
jgi:maltooligosyltrehalose trehalohydrolase